MRDQDETAKGRAGELVRGKVPAPVTTQKVYKSASQSKNWKSSAVHQVVDLFLTRGKADHSPQKRHRVARKVLTTVRKIGIKQFADEVKEIAQHRIQSFSLASTEVNTDHFEKQKENALKTIAWLEKVFKPLEGSVAVAIKASRGSPVLDEAFKQLEGGKQILALLAEGTVLQTANVRTQAIGKLSRVRARAYWGQDMMVDNETFIPVLQIGEDSDLVEENPDLLPIQSINQAEEAYGPFAPVVDAASTTGAKGP